jgi:hypothetical protein
VLSQGEGKDSRVCAYISRKMIPAERNYEVHDQELLAVVYALKKWRHYVQGTRTTVITDNWPTKFILEKPTLTPRQARWMVTLAEYNLDIYHKPGVTNVVADALSRRPDYQVNGIELEIETESLHRLDLGAVQMTIDVSDTYAERIRQDAASDGLYQRTLKGVKKGVRDDFTIKGDLLYYKGDRLYVPQARMREVLLREAHDVPLAGHLGRDKTYARLCRSYYWPRMRAEVEDYCKSCPSCQRIKPSQLKRPGLHQPLEIPKRPGQSASIDFITGLPRTKSGHTAILTIVDRFSKRVAFAPCTTEASAEVTARLFYTWWLTMGFGMPHDIVSDRGRQFVSEFWDQLNACWGTTLKFSTAYHPQTDGQTERVNRVVEDMLRAYVSPHHTDWDEFLPAAAFAYNTAVHSSTGAEPLRVCQGWVPADPLSRLNTEIAAGDERGQDAVAHAKRITDGIRRARDCIAQALQRQSDAVNRHRRHVEYRVGDQVMLSSAHLRQILPSTATAKLTARFVGPFKVAKVVGAAKLAY